MNLNEIIICLLAINLLMFALVIFAFIALKSMRKNN